MRTGEIADALQNELGVNRKTVDRALSRLVQAGKIRKSKKGHYEIRREL